MRRLSASTRLLWLASRPRMQNVAPLPSVPQRCLRTYLTPTLRFAALGSDVAQRMGTCRLSRQVREIPAAHSERNALYGLDPMHLAQLALRDSSRAVDLGHCLPQARLQQVGCCHAVTVERVDSPACHDLKLRCRAMRTSCWSSTARPRQPCWRGWP